MKKLMFAVVCALLTAPALLLIGSFNAERLLVASLIYAALYIYRDKFKDVVCDDSENDFFS